jgi:ribosome-associated toxin RatA of RatAB toxin-antitoxin module
MTFERAIVIAASPGELFALSQDYPRRLEWDPFLKSAELLDGATTADVGVRAYCVAQSGLSMETEYVSYNPPRACAVKMTRGPRLIRSFAGSWRFEEFEPGQTRVSFRYHLRARPWWLSWMLTPILGWVFARDTRKRLRALKTVFETVRPVAETKQRP